ncbi:MAG TPA: helix-turn-helix domain-containing protein [Hyphomicrobiaceae bacterium]|nr:helix-turn-helix domain-containing protein [Hyphomicrobiaceae bacterium]
MVLGGDPQLGHIFRNMRAAIRLPRDAIASRLATTPAIIEDLEKGAVGALPNWPETVRIVRGYCELLRLDPEPLLWRIQQLLKDGPTTDDAFGSLPAPSPPAARSAPVRQRAARPARRGLRRAMWLASFPIAVTGLVYAAILAPGPLYRAISLLPQSLAGPARAGLDNFVLYSAPRRDGLKWIDVGEPRLRKVDKLSTKAR